jgi:hypothetical protein
MLRYIWVCWRAWRMLKADPTGSGLAYVGLSYRGVPQLAIFVARDREAWRVTERALDAKLSIGDPHGA